jgi:hypothetical protein
MMRATILMLAALVVVAVVPLPGQAQTLEFKLLPRYSIATFKSDAQLETFVVRVDMTLVPTGIDKRDADMRGKPYLPAAAGASGAS